MTSLCCIDCDDDDDDDEDEDESDMMMISNAMINRSMSFVNNR